MKPLKHQTLFMCLIPFLLLGCNNPNNNSGDNNKPKTETTASKEELIDTLLNGCEISGIATSYDRQYSFTIASDSEYIFFSTDRHDGTGEHKDLMRLFDDYFLDYHREDGQYLDCNTFYFKDDSPSHHFYVGAFTGSLLMACDSIYYTSKESTTFLNRECCKYVYEYDRYPGLSDKVEMWREEYIIDISSKLCLKYTWTRLEDGFVSDDYEITSFSLSKSVEIINREKSFVKYKDWDLDVLNKYGFSDLAQPNGEYHGASLTENLCEYAAVYYIKETTLTDAEELFDNSVAVLYNAGAKYERFNGYFESSLEDLVRKQIEDNYLSFDAFTYYDSRYVNVCLRIYFENETNMARYSLLIGYPYDD